jgi:hypothetical protein
MATLLAALEQLSSIIVTISLRSVARRYVAREVYRVLTSSSVGPAGCSVDRGRVAAVTGVT